MTTSCYGAAFVAGLEHQLATARADKKTLADRLATVIGERDDLVAQNEQDIQGHGALNQRLFGDLQRVTAELETARADLKATRQIGAWNLATIDELNEQIEKLRKYLSDAACARDRFATQVSGLKDDVAGLRRQLANIQAARESRICVGEPPAPTVIDTVVLTGWNGMTMTQDHNGTIFRRTS